MTLERVNYNHEKLDSWKQIVDESFENTDSLTTSNQQLIEAVRGIVDGLDMGQIRVAEKIENEWTVNEWAKKAILLWFRLTPNCHYQAGPMNYHDLVPPKHDIKNFRVVPPGTARYGSYLAPGTILMPGYVNIGAYVDSGTMVDTWATVGSCAQIGKNIHLSGGVGIGGVLEPLQGKPVIIEDNVFVGSRCIIVEGAFIEENAVIAAGVTITGSTQIIDVTQPQEKIYKGFIPKNSVVIPGTRTKSFAAGEYQIPCALIIGQRKKSTDLKTGLNETLRAFNI